MVGSDFFHVLMGLHILLASSLTTKIQVCQNKDCCRNFGSKTSSSFYNLPQVLQDLTSSVEAESTGCLSKCDQGPNMQVASSSVILHRVKDHIQAAAALESLGITVPAQNMAAIAVLEKASQAVSAADKETAFNSVIRALEPKGGSSVLGRALVMRAEFYHDSGRHQDAIVDVNEALTMPVTIQVSRRAWRLLADAHASLGQVEDALRYLQDWMNIDPSFKSKIGSEMERLRRIADASRDDRDV